MEYNTWSQNDSYQYSNGYYIGTYYWFKYEPITWTIILNDSGKQYMYSDMILDAYYFNKALDNTVQYYKSALKTYMSSDFASFFTETEKDLLVNLTANGVSYKFIAPDESTITGPYTSPNITRKATPTAYAKCRGIYVEKDGNKEYSEWWLSTAASTANDVKIVNYYGEITKLGINELAGIRPFIAFDETKM